MKNLLQHLGTAPPVEVPLHIFGRRAGHCGLPRPARWTRARQSPQVYFTQVSIQP